jgi:hypothetical protein
MTAFATVSPTRASAAPHAGDDYFATEVHYVSKPNIRNTFRDPQQTLSWPRRAPLGEAEAVRRLEDFKR